jgi:hypothetical protein
MPLKAVEQMGQGYFCVLQYNMQQINKASVLQLWQLSHQLLAADA